MKINQSILTIFTIFAVVGCSVEQTEEGDMPEMDVEVEEGNMPEYDVDTADVDLDTEEKTVSVPDVDVDVDSQEETVTLPDLDIDMPEDDGDM